MTYFVTIECLSDPDETRLGAYLAIVSAMYQYCYSVLLKVKTGYGKSSGSIF